MIATAQGYFKIMIQLFNDDLKQTKTNEIIKTCHLINCFNKHY